MKKLAKFSNLDDHVIYFQQIAKAHVLCHSLLYFGYFAKILLKKGIILSFLNNYHYCHIITITNQLIIIVLLLLLLLNIVKLILK